MPKSLLEEYTFGGKLYALPHQAHFSMVLLNLDAFDDLNLDVPDLDWTIEDFGELLKKPRIIRIPGQRNSGALMREPLSCSGTVDTLAMIKRRGSFL